MKKKLVLFLINFLFISVLFAQNTEKDTTYWKNSIQTGLNFNQSSFSGNWKAGGVNSVALGAFFNGKFNYSKNKMLFDNEIQLQYGVVKNDGQSTRKNIDRIFIDSKLGYGISKSWNLFYSINFLSQFDIGNNYGTDATGKETQTIISRFMSPAYLTQSLGVEYKPVDFFSLRFGTGTLRQTFVTDLELYKTEPKNYGVPIGKTLRNEMAFQFIANFDKDVLPNLNLKARALIFSNYEDLAATDVRFDANLTAKINKWVNVNLSGVLLYDQDMDTKIQYSQTLALGFLYTFANFVETK